MFSFLYPSVSLSSFSPLRLWMQSSSNHQRSLLKNCITQVPKQWPTIAQGILRWPKLLQRPRSESPFHKHTHSEVVIWTSAARQGRQVLRPCRLNHKLCSNQPSLTSPPGCLLPLDTLVSATIPHSWTPSSHISGIRPAILSSLCCVSPLYLVHATFLYRLYHIIPGCCITSSKISSAKSQKDL